ncbi:MAG: LCP family protein [Solirubrobacterales bacterium]
MSEKPEYRVHRARRGWISRLLHRDEAERFAHLEDRPGKSRAQRGGRKGRFDPLRPERYDAEREPPKPVTFWRVVKWVALACAAWAALSVVLFFISAHVQSGKVSESTKEALDPSGNLLTAPNTILVIGSDRRPGTPGHGLADSIMLMRYGGGRAARLSIPRDTLADIPGFGPTKINAAYSIGGAPLMIETIKPYLGIEVNHIVEIDFKGFPKFVDSLGGVNMTFENCIRSRFEGRNIRFPEGENHLGGRQALDVVRVRKNSCNLAESDLTRARRQQQFLNAVKGRVVSPLTFPRWPWVGWRAPRAIRSDMGGAALMALFWDIETSGSLKPQLLAPIDPGANPLQVSDAEKQAKVQKFLEG